MKKKQNKKFPNKFVIITLIVLFVSFFIFLAFRDDNRVFQQPTGNEGNSLNTHTSQDLKISFQYPKEWFILDKDFRIYITSYATSHRDGYKPKQNQIEIHLSNANLCQKTLDEEIIKGGCSEAFTVQTQILDKKIQELTSGTFYTYTIKNSLGQQRIYYYLQHGDRLLQISKEPDPSQFDKEFEDIINSIRFL